MSIKTKRKLIQYLDNVDQPLRFNPFVFSRSFLLWALVGIIGGLIAGAYWIVLEFITHGLHTINDWKVIPLMTLTGLLVGLIIKWIGDPGEIHLIVNNIKFKNGKLNPKLNPSMILTSLLCVSSGGSLGPEAPLVQVTGSTATWIGKIFRLKGEKLRSLSIAGMASGFTALFGAPLGGSLFSQEILHHKYTTQYYKSTIPALVASCFSFVIFAIIVHLGLGPTWQLTSYTYSDPFDFLFAIGFAVIATLVGWIFISITKNLKTFLEGLKLPIFLLTTLGGLSLGLISYYFPITRYFGHHEINELLEKDLLISGLFAVLIFKIIAIAITVTTGWRGGFIIPLFFVGTTLGLLLHQFIPNVDLSLIVVSCMAAINVCVTRTPVSTTILLVTLTGFGHFIPILFASLTGYLLAPKIPFIKTQLREEK